MPSAFLAGFPMGVEQGMDFVQQQQMQMQQMQMQQYAMQQARLQQIGQQIGGKLLPLIASGRLGGMGGMPASGPPGGGYALPQPDAPQPQTSLNLPQVPNATQQ